jgi:hypothetical protein
VTTRIRRPVAVGLALVALVAATALVLKLRGDDPWAAKVDGTPISQRQVDRLAAYGADEARIEGRGVLKPGTPEYRELERQAIGLLVYHEELRQAAAALGIRVSAAEIDARLGPTSSGGDGEDVSGLLVGGAPARRAFVEESIRGELLYRKIYDRVTMNVAVDDTKRNAVMARWVARMKRDYAAKVEYAPRFRKS